MVKRGLLLLNLGSPASPEPEDVGAYLREFLMDPYVIDIPWPARWFLVNALIIPKRSHASAELYKKIWTAHGSPLVSITQRLNEKVKAGIGNDWKVAYCMRYGAPSIESAVDGLLDSDELLLFPLYPQYSLAATESSVQRVKSVLKQRGFRGTLKSVPAFYNQPVFLNAVAEVSRPFLKSKPWDKVLFSFHGLPERQVKRTASLSHCACNEMCCLEIKKENENCYRAQCYHTAREVAKLLGLSQEQYLVSFQSRLGRTPWIRPYSDHFYEKLPNEGVKRLAVLSPSFVADCLETLEEIAIRGKEQFRIAGGDDLFLIPCVNDDERWRDAVIEMAKSPSHTHLAL